MPARRLAPTASHLFQLLARPDGGTASDTSLLCRFITLHDESAFELLTWRHGPMIYSVCRRVLGDEHAAEDAFQAVLLVLARKARSISRKQSLAGWLYRVAYRAALRAREQARRRRRHEQPVAQMPAVPDPHESDPVWRELRQGLDEELHALAEKYRAPLVLCYLEGLTNEEAARQLGCPVGTVKTRLAHARRVLAGRLTRRGLTLAAGLMTAAVSPRAPAATVPAALVSSTTRAALVIAAGKTLALGAVSAPVAHLTEGVLRAMMLAKLKLATVVLATGLAVAGLGTASYRALANEKDNSLDDVPRTTPAEARVIQIKKEMARLKEDLRQAEETVAREKAMPPRGAVAIIFGDVPITRDELADHLLTHMRPQDLESYIIQRIVEHACRKEGITVTEADVDQAMRDKLRNGNITESKLPELLKRSNKTLREYREAMRLQLLLEQLARQRKVSEKDLRQAFAARYGDRIECDYVAWMSNQKEAAHKAVQQLQRGTITFKELAQKHDGKGGTIELGASHLPPELRRAALVLQPGDVSELIELPNAVVILKCKRRIPSDRSVQFEDVREQLQREQQRSLERRNVAELLDKLRTEARVKRLWTPPDDPSSP
jgi:RNA polymerase sigma factor (sigma-70 family)